MSFVTLLILFGGAILGLIVVVMIAVAFAARDGDRALTDRDDAP